LLRFARNDVAMVSHTASSSRRPAPELCIYDGSTIGCLKVESASAL
jgi:hypothetical protein